MYIDVSDDAPWDLRSVAFRDKVTALAAPIHGKPKDQLASDDLREQRRFRRLRAAAISGLAVLTVLAVVAAVIAFAQRQEAIRRLHDATVAKLSAEGAAMLAGDTPGGDVRALQELLAANAIEADGVPILNAQIARVTTQKIVDTSSFARQLAYSPDGSRVVTAEDDGTLRQWDSTTGKPIGSPLKGASGAVTGVVYTPDGHTIASTSFDGTMRLWNAGTGDPLVHDPQNVGTGLTSVAVSPNGTMIGTGGEDDTVRIWNPRTGHLRTTNHVFDDHRVAISDVAFDRSGALFAASGNNGSIVVFDTATGQPHAPIMSVTGVESTPGIVYRIAFSPDGHTIASGSDDLELWDVASGKNVRTVQVGTKKLSAVSAVAFSPDGRLVATGRNDGAVQVWNADTGAQFGQTLAGHNRSVFGAAFRPDGRQLATCGQDGTLRLWNTTVGEPMRGPDPVLVEAAFSPDGRRVAASGDTAVQQWDTASGVAGPPLAVSGAGHKNFGFVAGGRMVTAAGDGTVQEWDANTLQPIQPPVRLNIKGPSFHFAFSSDGRRVASGDDQDGTVQLWDVGTGRALGQPMTVDQPNALLALAFSPDGRHLVAGYNDGLRLWNADTTQPEGNVMTSTHGSIPLMSVAFTRDGKTVAGGREDGAVELWDATTRTPLQDSPLLGHSSVIFGVAFGVGGQMASGGVDGTVRLWDTSTGKPTAAPLMRSDDVTSVAVSPDGRLAASATLDGTLLLSPAVADPSELCDKLLTNMSHKQWRDWVSPAIDYIAVCPGLPVASD
ncbi:WD40 repeat domain-containing protein [Mycobacterium parmense]|uniref:WD40 repeat domain-containing protein n=1 Tax=Mycobacterium parmense TaxID=185642 RepID=UPI001E410E66|nr:WD40 repeat domain-containing protein [Mycobacterium parmense]